MKVVIDKAGKHTCAAAAPGQLPVACCFLYWASVFQTGLQYSRLGYSVLDWATVFLMRLQFSRLGYSIPVLGISIPVLGISIPDWVTVFQTGHQYSCTLPKRFHSS